MNKFGFLVLCLVLFSCKQNKNLQDSPAQVVEDSQSFARPADARVNHLDLTLAVDFKNKQLTGEAIWTIENSNNSDSIVFDTRKLNISKVTTGDDDKEVEFTLSPEQAVLGRRLSVPLAKGTRKVTIYYKTSPEAAALQWLDPPQTAGKVHPFLFTQSQAILARTWIPCQDGPSVRFTYNAKVTVPNTLLAVMSAVNPQSKNSQGVYSFKQENPIPSYLMALAVGDIAFKAVDDRCGVYAEPVVLEKAAWEFADMGNLVTAAEKLYGPYKWGRYDLLVLPPSFPFGGMENPMLTFATPTVIAGDRSLVSLVAHELAHSWSGNLVTNATWNDFWLNEGFTTYFERRIIEAVYGVEERQMLEALGLQDLIEELEAMGANNEDSRLKVNLDGRDPDLGVSAIAYEKGYFFLKKIEEVTGRAAFDTFLNSYFTQYAFQSVTTEKFINRLKENLLKNSESLQQKIDIDAWVSQPGLPKNISKVTATKFMAIDSLIKNLFDKQSISNNAEPMSGKIETTNEKLYLLRHLPKGITVREMGWFDKEFNFTNSGNAELQCAWFTLAVRSKYKLAFPKMEAFLINVGRRKFLVPIYKELMKSAEGRLEAKKIYSKARPNYHSVAYRSIDDLLNQE